MLDRFDFWRYSEKNNCWEFVRQYLMEKFGVPAEAVPKFGILPSDKRGMTKASIIVARSFVDSGPEDGAVACQFVGRVLYHVGIVDGGHVRHTGSHLIPNTQKSTIAQFERMAPTVYKKWQP